MHQLSVSARRIWSDSICGGFGHKTATGHSSFERISKKEIYGLFCPGFPAVNGVSLGGEVDAEFYDLLAGCEKRLVVAFFLYLLESDFGRLVALEFYYIDIFIGVEDDVYAAAGGVILRLDI